MNRFVLSAALLTATVFAQAQNYTLNGVEYETEILSFSQLSDPDGLVVKGDKVITSNISDKYLPGLLIGYIDTIETDANNLTKSGTISVATDFSYLSTVLVITDVKNNDYE